VDGTYDIDVCIRRVSSSLRVSGASQGEQAGSRQNTPKPTKRNTHEEPTGRRRRRCRRLAMHCRTLDEAHRQQQQRRDAAKRAGQKRSRRRFGAEMTRGERRSSNDDDDRRASGIKKDSSSVRHGGRRVEQRSKDEIGWPWSKLTRLSP
jgi:hypothetical protein